MKNLHFLSKGQNGGQGVIYIAFGTPYLAMALNSLKTLKKHNPGLAACVLTNIDNCFLEKLPYWEQGKDWHIYVDDENTANRNYKIAVNQLSPFDQSVFLDCDTEVLASFEPFYFMLSYFDLLIAPSVGRGLQAETGTILFCGSRGMHNTPYWNSGVIAFKKSNEVTAFFNNWRRLFKEKMVRFDQPSLAEALITSNLRFAGIDRMWNWSDQMWLFSDRVLKKRNVQVLHYMYLVDSKLTKNLYKTSRLLEFIEAVPKGTTKELLHFIINKRKTRYKKILRYGDYRLWGQFFKDYILFYSQPKLFMFFFQRYVNKVKRRFLIVYELLFKKQLL